MSHGDLLGFDSSSPDFTRSAKSLTDSGIGYEIRSSQALLADPLQRASRARIPYSEKMKWSADSSPVLQQKFNSFDAVNANIALFHQRAAGDADSGSCGHLHINWHESDSVRLDDAGWSVVKPRYWWHKNFANPGRSSQISDGKASSLLN